MKHQITHDPNLTKFLTPRLFYCKTLLLSSVQAVIRPKANFTMLPRSLTEFVHTNSVNIFPKMWVGLDQSRKQGVYGISLYKGH